MGRRHHRVLRSRLRCRFISAGWEKTPLHDANDGSGWDYLQVYREGDLTSASMKNQNGLSQRIGRIRDPGPFRNPGRRLISAYREKTVSKQILPQVLQGDLRVRGEDHFRSVDDLIHAGLSPHVGRRLLYFMTGGFLRGLSPRAGRRLEPPRSSRPFSRFISACGEKTRCPT